MPRPVSRALSGVVDEMMPEIKTTIMDAVVDRTVRVKDKMLEDKLMTSKRETCCMPNPVSYLRALVLYAIDPFDKSIWKNIKDPLWWFFKLVSVFPAYHVAIIWWIFLFFIRDNKDECDPETELNFTNLKLQATQSRQHPTLARKQLDSRSC
eukprot:FR736415.1.p1 GENE.FR736415.1~~FR736415.1.p1  ORF type:complete len:152 (+),score=13.54 FR736415.1:222-677(+)